MYNTVLTAMAHSYIQNNSCTHYTHMSTDTEYDMNLTTLLKQNMLYRTCSLIIIYHMIYFSQVLSSSLMLLTEAES